MNAVAQAVAWDRRAVSDAEAPTAAPPALLVVIEALVEKSAAAGAKTITVACTQSELTVVDDGRGLPRLEALDADGRLRRALLEVSPRPTMNVTSTHVHVRNRASIDVRMSATAAHEQWLPTPPSGAREGFMHALPWKTGTSVTILGISPALEKRRHTLGPDLEARLRSAHPGVAINVTI